MTSTRSDVVDEAFIQDLHGCNDELRALGPVRQVRLRDGAPVWVVTRYDEARAALSDARLSKDAAAGHAVVDAKTSSDVRRGELTRALTAHMLNTDPPDHTRLRKLVMQAFTPRRVQNLRPRVVAITDQLLDELDGRSEVDLLEALAFPLPIQVICELLGVEESHYGDFRAWTNAMLDHPDDQAAAARSAEQMAAYLIDLIGRKRERPADDLLTGLLEASADADRLSDSELISMVFLLLVAGHETTVNLIGNGVLALLRHPDQWAALRADPDLASDVVEETLRFDSPVTHGTFRFTREAMVIGDVRIPAGEIVWIGLAAANRDPRRFDGPHEFDAFRGTRGHLAFGHGIHFCLGAQLARLEGQVALRRLVERFELRPAPALDEVSWRFSTLIRGLRELPVLVDRRLD